MWKPFLLGTLLAASCLSQQSDWRQAAHQRIEQIRKDHLIVRLVDSTGQPVPNAQLRVELVEHEFGFGTAVSGRYLLDDSPDAARYRDFIRENFNMAVLENDLKWPQWERDRGPALEAIAWLKANGISRVRGHTLVWPSWRWLPKDLKDLENQPEALRARVRAHIQDVVSANQGKLLHWDVLNEPFSEHDLMRILGPEVMAEWFREAKRHDSQATLFINDYGILSGRGENREHQNHYDETIRNLIAWGAPLEGIGLQGHFSEPTSPERMLAILDRFGEFGLPLAITEFDFDTKDEQAQADFLRDLLTVCFSHPRVKWFLMWGFWEGRHWKPNGAMIRKDWSPKPSFAVWRDLVHQQWQTRETRTTDLMGAAVVHGYRGRYRIQASQGNRTVSAEAILGSGGSTITLTMP